MIDEQRATDEVLLLRGAEVAELLEDREEDIIRVVHDAYLFHYNATTLLPHSTFLRFPHSTANRIIALPAQVGGEHPAAGIKWISSFPGNRLLGLDRASAVIILNSISTGRAVAILEGSIISAKRTAASAALAARYLSVNNDCTDEFRIGVVGCGCINFELLRFLLRDRQGETTVLAHDLDPTQLSRFLRKCEREFGDVRFEIAGTNEQVLRACSLVSLATTATKPHISDLSLLRRGATVLHISLRDFTADVILGCENVVDDIDHICRAETSIHLAEMRSGRRDFINCVLGELLLGVRVGRRQSSSVVIFSPFGLGVLDIALAAFVWSLALQEKVGLPIRCFFPAGFH